ncbi:MAG: hypothetical protein GOV15_00980 [Candidatus Diapherotrites archaeon]|nr:hypothetical protein [Candidatus Diapherotrites archaeon]
MAIKACPACGSTEFRDRKKDKEILCMICNFEGRSITFQEKSNYFDFLDDLKATGVAFFQRMDSLKEPKPFGSAKVFYALTENGFVHLILYFFVGIMLVEGTIKLFPDLYWLRGAALGVLGLIIIKQSLSLAHKKGKKKRKGKKR